MYQSTPTKTRHLAQQQVKKEAIRTPKSCFFLLVLCQNVSTNTMCQQARSVGGIPASAKLQSLEDFLNLLLLLLHQGFAGDLMVRNIQLKHSGKYVCMVHTEVDTVSAAAELTVRGGC